MPENEKEYTQFWAKMDFDGMDEKLKRLLMLRNEMWMLCKELGIEVREHILEVKIAEKQ